MLFLFALVWARSIDPFQRIWFTVAPANHGSVKGVAVLPKPAGPRPVVISLHGSGGSMLTSGTELRQLAELGLAAVCIEYDQTNNAVFDEQFSALLAFIRKQDWADTNSMALVGSSLGAQNLLSYLTRHPENQPQLLIRLSGGWVPELDSTNASTRCPVLLVHGGRDNVFPPQEAVRVASLFRKRGVAVAEKMLPGLGHSFESDRPLVIRLTGEYCKAALTPNEPFRGVAQRKVAPFWVWMLPAFGWGVFCFWRRWRRQERPIAPEPLKLWEKILRVAAVVLATLATAETAVHLVTPQLPAGERTLKIARKWLVAPKMLPDFTVATSEPVWQGKPLKWLLDNVELSHYNRNELINWQVDEQIYREYVLPPEVGDFADGELNWRRPLWESFYPRIRKQNLPEDAARIVVRFLRERVTISRDYHPSGGIVTAWERGITDVPGFERIYVAALRSVGIGARLDGAGRAEFWTGKAWAPAPRPIAESFL